MDAHTPTPPPSAGAQFQTHLQLDERQLKRLLDFAVDQLQTACKAMGRVKNGQVEAGSWLDKRRLNQLWYEGDMAWREGDTYLGGVFNDSNFTRADGKRYVRHMATKVTDDLVGTTPFFAAMRRDTAAGGPNAQLVMTVEGVVQDVVDASNVPESLRDAVELALVRNEAVVKVRYEKVLSSYVGPARVLVSAPGAPVVTPVKQLYVYQNDDLLPVPGAPRMVALEKDPSFVVSEEQAEAFQYEDFEALPQTQVEKEGIDARVLDPRDFICDPNNRCIHEAPLVAHYYDESPAKLKEAYGPYAISGTYYSAPESGAKAAIAVQGERPPGGSCDAQWVPVGEVYLRFDADEDGIEEHILLVLDRSNQQPIFYDYLFNHLKKRPFEVLHGLRRVPGRWYGVGIYSDKFDQLVFIDKTYNRINLKASKTCTVTAVRRDVIEEWSDMKIPISLGGDEVLTLNSKWQGDKPGFIQQVRLVEVTSEEVELMNMTLQAMDQEFGYISAADASATSLNQSRTATGIASIERSGNNIVKAVERVHTADITAILEQVTDIALEHMDPTRLAFSKDAQLLTLNQSEIRDLPKNVKLLLTRSRSSELLTTNDAATQKANEWFDILEAKPRRAKALRPMYLNQLKALEVPDADELLPEVTDEMLATAEQAGRPPEPTRESLSVSYKDLLPSEKAQALQRIGITPGSPQEAAGMAPGGAAPMDAAMPDAAAAEAMLPGAVPDGAIRPQPQPEEGLASE